MTSLVATAAGLGIFGTRISFQRSGTVIAGWRETLYAITVTIAVFAMVSQGLLARGQGAPRN